MVYLFCVTTIRLGDTVNMFVNTSICIMLSCYHITNILKVPKTNLKLGVKSFKFRASALWNGLNINIKYADNIDVF